MDERKWIQDRTERIRLSEQEKEEIWLAAMTKRKGRGRMARHMVRGAAAFAAAAIVLVFLVFTAGRRSQPMQGTQLPRQETELSRQDAVQPLSAGAEETGQESMAQDKKTDARDFRSILLVGLDRRAFFGESVDAVRGDQADMAILCSIHKETGDVRLAAIDQWTLMKGYGTEDWQPIHAGLFREGEYAGTNQLLSTINRNLDLAVTDVIYVDFAAAVQAVNALGGIMLDIPSKEVENHSLDGYLDEIVRTTGIGTNGQFGAGGMQLCDGPKALAYIRSGKQVGGAERGRRAATVLEQLLKKGKEAGIPALPSLANDCFSALQTNLTPAQLLELVSLAAGGNMDWCSYPAEEARNMLPEGEAAAVDGQAVMGLTYTDLPAQVKSLHRFLYGEDDYAPSAEIHQLGEEMEALNVEK